MGEKVGIEYIDKEDYSIYNLAIERLTRVITELGFAIGNCKDLEEKGFDMDLYKLNDAMTDIATTFAGAVAGLKYLKPRE